jgi:hypothetical protein
MRWRPGQFDSPGRIWLDFVASLSKASGGIRLAHDPKRRTTMLYVCLVHFDDKEVFRRMSEAEKRELDIASSGYDRELARSGNLVRAEALQAPESAVLVRVRDGRISATDGPFLETKEQLGGFILIEARDLNDAIRIAGGIPLAQHGTIEVRPIYHVPQHEDAAP